MTIANGFPITPAARGDSQLIRWPATAPVGSGAMRGLKDISGTPPDDPLLARAAAEARTALREAAIAAADAAAVARSLAELLDEALAVLNAAESAPAFAPAPVEMRHPGAAPLSPREREVLAFVVAGRTNKAIAEALFVSPNTVKTHVASLLNKLRADSRVQLAAIATRNGFHHRVATGAP